MDLEDELGIEVSSTEFDQMETVLDMLSLIEEKVCDTKQRKDLAECIRLAIERARGVETSLQDFPLRFEELFGTTYLRLEVIGTEIGSSSP